MMFSNPMYSGIKELQAQSSSYDEALKNSKALENERDKLTTKDNAIDPDDKIKLQKLLPDHVDNIRLILEIEQIGLPYSMTLKDVKYNSTTDSTKTTGGEAGGATTQGGGTVVLDGKAYGAWDLEFSTTGTYSNFLSFIRDIEQNLRIVDISSITFASDTSSLTGNKVGTTVAAPSVSSPQTYKYDFKIKTYWLKNQ